MERVMRGPYRLTPISVDMHVPDRIGGVYGLGSDPKKITVLGRAETELRDKIKSFWSFYEFFWYEPALSAAGGFRIHCREYHKQLECGELEDKTHPVPHQPGAKCPDCGT